jgi:hypothetical protein
MTTATQMTEAASQSFSSSSSQRAYVKVFGERNTGTNFLNQLLLLNVDATVLDHGTNARASTRLSRFSCLSASEQLLFFERLVDQDRHDEYPQNYGWKHSFLTLATLQGSPLFGSTAFLLLIRNPFRFLSSLHRRPYNLLPRPTGSLADFIAAPLLANQRDGLDDVFVENPVDLWNRKVASFFDVQSALPHQARIIAYEQLVADPENHIRCLSQLDLRLRPEPCRIPARSTKGDGLSFTDYQQEARSYDPLRALGSQACRGILERLDPDVVIRTPYHSLCQHLCSRLAIQLSFL